METSRNLIGGRWQDATSDTVLDVVNPATEEAIARFPVGSPDDVDRAVDAAIQAQPAWAGLPVVEHAQELAELECVDARQRDLVRTHVDDAVRRGATVRTGGHVPERQGFFYPATVLTDVDDSMLVMTEETFGPIAPVVVIDSFEEGIERASRSRFGLTAAVYTGNPEHIAATARLSADVIWVNKWQGGGPERLHEPAGESGLGATGAQASYDAATRPASVHIAATPARQAV